MRVRGVTGLALAALLLAGAACGSDDGDASDGESPAATTTDTVVIKDFEFNPGRVEAKVGDTITVRNKDTATHSLTAKDDKALFDSGQFTAGERQVTLTKAGTFDFACTVHPYMEGVIQVSA